MENIVKKYGGRIEELKPLLKEAMVDYHWGFDEFFMYDYPHLSLPERESIVPEYEKNVFCDRVNDHGFSRIFDSKWESFRVFQPYYDRDVALIDGIDSLNDGMLDHFLEEYTRFVLKPDSEACGRGITIIEGTSVEDSKQQIRNILHHSKGRYVVEEIICQDERMAAFHPQSINTVRIPTIRYDNRVEIIHPFIRIGRGLAIVDNAGAGGIMGNIDKETGTVYVACDELNHSFETHPDTAVPIVGFVVPCWKEAMAFVKKLASTLPQVRYVGWDLALTERGWIMIEGNDKGQFVFQIPSQMGFRSEFKRICKDLIGREDL